MKNTYVFMMIIFSSLFLLIFFIIMVNRMKARTTQTESYGGISSPHVFNLSTFYLDHFQRPPDPVALSYYSQGRGRRNIQYDAEHYLSQVLEGKQAASESRLLITGLIRNAVTNIPFLEYMFLQLRSVFLDVLFLIVENDSVDSTRDHLLLFASKYPDHVHILCPPAMENTNHVECTIIGYEKWFTGGPDVARIYRLSHLRNFYLDYIETALLWKSYPYLLIMDLDLKGMFAVDGLLHSIFHMSSNPLIHAIACNGMVSQPSSRFVYYDSFAYIEHGDPIEWNAIFDKTSHDREVAKYITRKYSTSMELDSVVSAFGGCCLYRLPTIFEKHARYSSSSLGKFSCEHSHFHQALGKGSIFVNPRMLFLIESSK